jgi:hypothetical protein
VILAYDVDEAREKAVQMATTLTGIFEAGCPTLRGEGGYTSACSACRDGSPI